MLNERITVKIKNVYGRDLVYPVCERAKLFAEISGAATLTPQVVKLIKSLGFGLVVHNDAAQALEGGNNA
jgi:hypothetical protein